jgi:ribosomal protein S18 acetylase RimI-like enzyme
MVDWAEQKLTEILRRAGKDTIRMMWILEDDAVMDQVLRQRELQPGNADVLMVCPLDEPIRLNHPPDGWTVRACRGLDEVEKRAEAQHAAFGSSTPMDKYVKRFQRFMQSDVYNPEWDLVAAREDGKIGTFCITWPDPLNRVVLFEPVGTQPDFQRQGLGKAVMLEALRSFRANGMRQAIVTTPADNVPAIKLYESAGFRIDHRLMVYQKSIKN